MKGNKKSISKKPKKKKKKFMGREYLVEIFYNKLLV